MLTKAQLQAFKQTDVTHIYRLLDEALAPRDLLFILEHLGHLPADFDTWVLVPYLSHESSDIRYWAVKNIGKQANPFLIPRLAQLARSDPDPSVRREAVSSIGRMRLPEAIPTLIAQIDEPDPNVLLQVIRGLLVFRHEPMVQEALQSLRDHPHEVIQRTVRGAFLSPTSKRPDHGYTDTAAWLRNVVVHADVQQVLPHVPDESIHLTFTSPPYYNARDYAIYASYTAYLDFLTEVFQQVHRITKEGCFCIVNTSPVIMPRVSRAHASKRYPIPFDLHARLVQIGWEFIDDIVWLKPETSVKNRNAGFLQHRKPLGYKPNPVTEYLMVYRKQTDKLIDWNMRHYSDDVVAASRVQGEYETSNVWRIDPTSDRVHSAVFPLELCARVVRFYSYVGDLVFDPFGGSGTLGRAARDLGRYFFMVEQEPRYIERMREVLGTGELFEEQPPRFRSLEQFLQQEP